MAIVVISYLCVIRKSSPVYNNNNWLTQTNIAVSYSFLVALTQTHTH